MPKAASLALVLLTYIGPRVLAQPAEQVRRAFQDLRDDKVPNNCARATEWLRHYSAELKSELLDELDKTDWQGRDAICHILWDSASFEPDERFLRFTMALLRDDEVGGNAGDAANWLMKQGNKIQPLLIDELSKTDNQGREGILRLLKDMPRFEPDEQLIRRLAAQMIAGDTDENDWIFIHDHFDAIEPVLMPALTKPKLSEHEMYMLWAMAWVMKKRGELDRYASAFSAEVMRAAAMHLRSDKSDSNAGWTVRFFLLLGDQSRATLQEVVRSGDEQARSLARAVLDGLGGSRNAFGYLQARVELSRTPFGPEVADPVWLAQATAPYKDNKRPYRGN